MMITKFVFPFIHLKPLATESEIPSLSVVFSALLTQNDGIVGEGRSTSIRLRLKFPLIIGNGDEKVC